MAAQLVHSPAREPRIATECTNPRKPRAAVAGQRAESSGGAAQRVGRTRLRVPVSSSIKAARAKSYTWAAWTVARRGRKSQAMGAVWHGSSEVATLRARS